MFVFFIVTFRPFSFMSYTKCKQGKKQQTSWISCIMEQRETNPCLLFFEQRRRKNFIPLKISNSLVCWRPCFKSHWLWKCDSKGGFFDGKENKKRFFQLRTIFSLLRGSQTLDIFYFCLMLWLVDPYDSVH